MNIWLTNHYAVPPQYYPLARPSLFAKNLIKMGHEVTIIAASTVHNSENNLIEGKEKVKKFVDDGIPYVLIKCSDYQGNGLKRIINILEFAQKLPKVCDGLEKPDAIVATSFDPLSCYAGIKYAKKHGIKAIAEIADLWPETLVEYGNVSKWNPVVLWLRRIEKSIYTEADDIVFTAEGEYDYIIEQGWDKIIPQSKVHYINNGIDLAQFDYNKENYTIVDMDLDNPDIFKVVYAGSIRKVNNVGKLLDIAKLINDERIRILIWGDGDELPELRKRVSEESIENVVFKGRIDKKYIPYITSKADLNIAHNTPSPLFRFGISFNKLFDYLAAGRPILSDFPCPYNPAVQGDAGIDVQEPTSENIVKAIEQMTKLDQQTYDKYCNNARRTAEKYDFRELTKKLFDIISR